MEAELDKANQYIASLEDRQIPRRISVESRKILLDGLREFEGQRFLIYVSANNGEAFDLANDIASILLGWCGWTSPYEGGIRSVNVTLPMTPGVIVLDADQINYLPGHPQNSNRIKTIAIEKVFERSGVVMPPDEPVGTIQPVNSTTASDILKNVISIPNDLLPLAENSVAIFIGQKPSPLSKKLWPYSHPRQEN